MSSPIRYSLPVFVMLISSNIETRRLIIDKGQLSRYYRWLDSLKVVAAKVIISSWLANLVELIGRFPGEPEFCNAEAQAGGKED